MKRMISLLLALLMLLIAVPALAGEVPADHQALMDAADALNARMIGLCGSEAYAAIYTSAGELQTLVTTALSHDFSQPARRAVLTMNAEAFDLAWTMFGYEALPEDAKQLMIGKMADAFASGINASQGTNWIAATSIAALSDAAVITGVKAGSYVVITDYGDDRPMLCDSVTVHEDGAALLHATLLDCSAEMRERLMTISAADMISALGGGDSDDAMVSLLLGVMPRAVYTMD